MRLSSRVALVTGSTSGIGRGIALAFAREGAAVVLNGARRSEHPNLVSEVAALGAQAIYIQADVSQPEQVRALVEGTVGAFGRLDILVNNAAIGHGGGKVAHELPVEEWEAVLGVCLKGPFLCARFAIPEMIQGGGGVIVNIGSVEGVRGFASDTAYMSAKGGLMQLNRALAVDYAAHNIRSVLIQPGFIATPLNEEKRADPIWMEKVLQKPLFKRPGTAEEVGRLAVFLASDEAAYITGTEITIDGGWLVR